MLELWRRKTWFRKLSMASWASEQELCRVIFLCCVWVFFSPWLCQKTCRVLAPNEGSNLYPPVEVWSCKHWSTRELQGGLSLVTLPSLCLRPVEGVERVNEYLWSWAFLVGPLSFGDGVKRMGGHQSQLICEVIKFLACLPREQFL